MRAGPLSGFIILDKPEGFTSMQAVAAVRRRAGRAKTGHAGTLDPLATGVLVIAIGRAATRHLSAIMGTDKRYSTVIDLSAFTATDDREGERREVCVAVPPPADDIRAAVRGFVGEISQRPPSFSAIKIAGRRAYKHARQGRDVQLAPRPVIVHGIDVVSYHWPRVELAIHCGKGSYVRSLARDLGLALGTGGHCLSIRRTAVGPFRIEDAVTLDDVPDPLGQESLIDIERALAMVRAHGGG